MFRLAEATTNDTAAVKWITYLTLLYLPGSFVAVSVDVRELQARADKNASRCTE